MVEMVVWLHIWLFRVREGQSLTYNWWLSCGHTNSSMCPIYLSSNECSNDSLISRGSTKPWYGREAGRSRCKQTPLEWNCVKYLMESFNDPPTYVPPIPLYQPWLGHLACLIDNKEPRCFKIMLHILLGEKPQSFCLYSINDWCDIIRWELKWHRVCCCMLHINGIPWPMQYDMP